MNIPNPFHIAEGAVNVARKNLGIADDEVELLAKLRESVCKNQCKHDRGKSALSDEGKCTKCNCTMAVKWRSRGATCIMKEW